MYGFTNMNLISLLLVVLTFYGYSIALSCCTRAEADCRNVCAQMTLLEDHMSQLEHLTKTAQYCPPSQVEFWRCVNSTVPVIHQMTLWPARPCCDLAVDSDCKASCREMRGHGLDDDISNCHRGREKKLYNCIQKMRDGEHCCSSSGSFNCQLACRGTLISKGISMKKQRNVIRKQCPGFASRIYRCLHRQPVKEMSYDSSLPCCYKAEAGSQCRATCLHGIQNQYSEERLAEELEMSCGPVLPNKYPIWACFLKNQPDGPEEPIIDGAKLQCCYKAPTLGCKNLCVRTFSTDWAKSWEDFNTKCQGNSAPVLDGGILDDPMSSCLAEVDQPCELGCSGLGFCSNFNSRPTEMFRSCNSQTDDAARASITYWRNGTIKLPQMTIPVKDINECEPEMWKALACALQIKPCAKKTTPLPLCREDCIYILNKCVDYSRLQPGHTLQLLCNTLSPGDSHQGSCISVRQYLTESPHKSKSVSITTPCKNNPCGVGEVCWINRRKCRHPEVCQPYVCHKACGMGSNTNVYIPRNHYARRPNVRENSDHCIHYKVCQCKHNELSNNCQEIPCVKQDSCVLAEGHVKKHGEHFHIDCKHCICNSGKVVCQKHPCSHSMRSKDWTGIPCDCTSSYNPRCGANGKTYPNSCLANKCAGLTTRVQEVQGVCHEERSCATNFCSPDQFCIPKKQVCLSINKAYCQQYECISRVKDKCNHHHHDPVCDTRGEEFTNPCLLFAHKRQIAYRGHCQKHCAMLGKVCGHNGETYHSQCAALADRTTVDYKGECRVVGQFSANFTGAECRKVQCFPVVPKNCRPIIPPGGCCPVCAAELRVLFSQDLADNAVLATSPAKPITVQGVLEVLSHQITVSECDVFGYLSLNNDLVILLTSVIPSPTNLQVEACVKEAERISYLINTDSPLFKSYLTLTPLLLATMRSPGVSSQTSTASLISSGSLSLITTLFLIYFILKRT